MIRTCSVRRFLQLVIVLLVPSLSLLAQTTGKIAGKVTDKSHGDALIGVTVLASGTNAGAVTDVDGHYQLSIAPGTYTVNFKYIGYNTKSITGVVVKAAATTSLDIILDEPSSKSLQEVVVTASYKQESINALYTAQKNNAVVSDGISAEAIRRSPDRNTGEVLKRVSGTSIQDNRFVVVRGLGDRYNSTLMNSALLPSTEPDKKAFSFDIIPSTLIDNITIYKTASPDLPGDFAGGAVKVLTKDFPDQPFMELQVATAYNTKTTGKDFIKGLPDGKTDLLGWDNGGRALPGAYTSAANNYTELETADKIAISKQFPNTFTSGKTDQSLPSLGVQYAMGNSFHLSRNRRFGYIFSVNYGTSRRATERTRDEYLPDTKALFFGYHDYLSVATHQEGSVLNMAYSYGRSKIAWKNFFSNTFNTDFSVRNGANYESGVKQILSYDNETTQNGLFNSVVEGSHALKHDKLQVTWNASYGYSYRNQPDQRILAFVRDDPDSNPTGDTVYRLKVPVENSPAIHDAGRIYTRLYENILGGGVNLAAPFKLFGQDQQVKFGGLVSYRNRHFSAIALGYSTNNIYGATIHLDGKTVTPENIFSGESLDQRQLFLAKIDLNSKDYQGLATLGAGYVMLDNKFGEKVRLAWGARLESYAQELKSLNQAQNKHNNTDVLPSANFTYLLTEKTNIRASYFQSVNRPEFRELADFRYYDYENEYNVIGNPTLKRASISNADLRFEHFTGAGEIISASVFYKQFKDPVEQLNEGNNVLSYSNASKARDYGAEVEVRKRLSFVPGKVFEHLVFYANAAVINSQVTLDGVAKKTPLQGQSPYLVNGGLTYVSADNGFSANLLYNRIGQRLRFRGTAAGADTYEKPRDLLDFQVTKKVIRNKGEIKLNISDIFSQPIAWYYKFGNGNTAYKSKDDKIINSFKPGTTFTLALRYSF